MRRVITQPVLVLLPALFLGIQAVATAQVERVLDTPQEPPAYENITPGLTPEVVTNAEGFDNYDMGVDNAEPHTSVNPLNPLWFFNAWNTNRTHRTLNGIDWTFSAPFFGSGFSMRGDPVTAYDSLGNLYYENMYSATSGSDILGCKVMRSTDNGATWLPSVTAIDGVDKNWIACDQTAGPFANYVYTTMTAEAGGNFSRSTDFGETWTNTWTFATQSLPGMMVAVGPNVLGGGDVPGGCVYVVTNNGSASSSVFTFYRSQDGGASFAQRSALNVAGYVGTLNSIGRLVINNARTRPYPFITADNSYGPYRGRLYLVYASNVPAGNGNRPDIFLQYSTDQGATWSARVQVNDNANPTSTNEWFPAIWCDKTTGRLYCKWYDMRNDPTNQRAWVYGTYTDDGGQTFAPNQKISNADFVYPSPACSPNTNCYRGDYDAITSNGYVSMSVWTDFRSNNYGSYAGYFPDFAMKVGPTVDTLRQTDSADVWVKVPDVRLYTYPVRFSASLSPAGSLTLGFPDGDSLTAFPDSIRVRIVSAGAAIGTYTLTVTGSGPEGAPVHRRTASILVRRPTITLTAPIGGELWPVGAVRQIRWNSTILPGSVQIELSRDGGVTYPETLFTNTANDGVEHWPVSGPPTTSGRMRVRSLFDTTVTGGSAFNFSVVQATLSLTGPAGGDLWPIGSSQGITWTSTNVFGNVMIGLSRDGGVSYPETLFAATPNDGAQSWAVVGPATSDARVMVTSLDVPTAQDASDSSFRIAQSALSLIAPVGGERWLTGVVQTIRWNSVDLPGTVRIELSRNGGVSFPEVLFTGTLNDGEEPWTVTGPPTGAALLRLSAVNVPGLADTSDSAFVIEQTSVPVASGWNLVSVPVTLPELLTQLVFPTASSQAFAYGPDGYRTGDTLEYGRGYWLKFDSASVVLFAGVPRELDTIDVPAGWTLVGSIGYPVEIDSILQIPPGFVQGFFRYQPGGGYQPAVEIRPGEGLWAKTTQSGQLVVRRSGTESTLHLPVRSRTAGTAPPDRERDRR